MLGLEDIVGKRFESVGLVVVEELRVEERNLFAIFPIGATIQDGGKRKRSDVINQIVGIPNIKQIIVITDLLHAIKKIFNLFFHRY